MNTSDTSAAQSAPVQCWPFRLSSCRRQSRARPLLGLGPASHNLLFHMMLLECHVKEQHLADVKTREAELVAAFDAGKTSAPAAMAAE